MRTAWESNRESWLRLVSELPGEVFGWSQSSIQELVLRGLAVQYGIEQGWVDKYGAKVKTEMFEMHPYCWCDKKECPWCGPQEAPHFSFDGGRVKVRWYKYIGRDMSVTYKCDGREFPSFIEIWDKCKKKGNV